MVRGRKHHRCDWSVGRMSFACQRHHNRAKRDARRAAILEYRVPFRQLFGLPHRRFPALVDFRQR